MWTSFCQHLCGCGRDATVFIVALVSMLAGLIFVPAMGWLTWPILGALLAWLCVMMIRAVVRAARPGAETWTPATALRTRLAQSPRTLDADGSAARALPSRAPGKRGRLEVWACAGPAGVFSGFTRESREASAVMKLSHGLHLAYCTNIHRGESWAEIFAALQTPHTRGAGPCLGGKTIRNRLAPWRAGGKRTERFRHAARLSLVARS